MRTVAKPASKHVHAFRERALDRAAERRLLGVAGIRRAACRFGADRETDAVGAAGNRRLAADARPAELRLGGFPVADDQLAEDDDLVAVAAPLGDLVAPAVAVPVVEEPDRFGLAGIGRRGPYG